MAAEVDLAQWVLPMVFATVIPVGLFALTRYGKTSEGTLTGTIRLEGLKSNVDEVKETMDKGFEKIEKLLNSRDIEMRQEFTKTNERIESISSKLSLHEYRLELLDRERRTRARVFHDDDTEDSYKERNSKK